MSELAPNGRSAYTDEQRIEAATQYAVTGSLKKVEQLTGIPNTTVHGWKNSDWWDEVLVAVRGEKASEHRARYSQLVDAAQAKALELLPTTTNAKEAMLVACMATDKVRLADNMPTSISGSSNTAQMQALADQFAKLSKDHRAIQDTVVAVQGPKVE